MAVKRLNVFVHHHEDINVKVKMLVNHVLNDSEYENNLIWEHLNNNVNELIMERKCVENMRMDLEKQKFICQEKKKTLKEMFQELVKQKELYQKLKKQNEDLLEQTRLAMQDNSISHM